jgi:hypothetical protein
VKKPEAVNDSYAIASLVLSLLWLGGIGSVLAIIFSVSSDHAAFRSGRRKSGMAVAGCVLGVIGLFAAIIVVIAVISAAKNG